MDFNEIKTMKVLADKIGYHAKKQQIHAENFANSTTPGYTRKDVTSPDFAAMLGKATNNVTIKTTDPKHISSASANGDYQVVSSDIKVKMDMEALQMTQNSGEYSKATSAYKKMMILFKEAIGNSN